jgi:hypothetical protein
MSSRAPPLPMSSRAKRGICPREFPLGENICRDRLREGSAPVGDPLKSQGRFFVAALLGMPLERFRMGANKKAPLSRGFQFGSVVS